MLNEVKFHNLSKDIRYKFFKEQTNRIDSYQFLENFIANNLYNSNFSNSDIVQIFNQEISKFDDVNLAFLLIHCGLIPEHYDYDSTEEVMYSKLNECVVFEWVKRVGFNNSNMPRSSSSIEDVTLINEKNQIIVCDVKSYRLGRSQASPNVKDILKEGDIKKWLDKHNNNNIVKYDKLGGLVVFPSIHDWKKGSDFYQYVTNFNNPILALNYEYLAYILLNKIDICNIYKSYKSLFPTQLIKQKISNRDIYHSRITMEFFSDDNNSGNKKAKKSIKKWKKYEEAMYIVIDEKVKFTKENLEKNIKNIKNEIQIEINNINDIDILKKMLIAEKEKNSIYNLERQVDNILKFRLND